MATITHGSSQQHSLWFIFPPISSQFFSVIHNTCRESLILVLFTFMARYRFVYRWILQITVKLTWSPWSDSAKGNRVYHSKSSTSKEEYCIANNRTAKQSRSAPSRYLEKSTVSQFQFKIAFKFCLEQTSASSSCKKTYDANWILFAVRYTGSLALSVIER